MKKILSHLEPKTVFEQFEQICQIPHGSYNTKALADYCEGVALNNNCPCLRDGAGNLIITIPASPGHEAAEAIILQGHLDMVCEKSSQSTHDFKNDPLSLQVNGDFISANQTTLGADDGIGIAMCLALMADHSIVHPKLYCVFTTEEEVGMDGAYALDLSSLSDVHQMINLDSEDEGQVTVGCAGGARVACTFPLHRVKAKGLQATITVSGLAGGHSGDMINKFGFNANILMGKILAAISKEIDISISHLSGGTKDNAIPQTAQAELLIGPDERESLDLLVNKLQNTYKNIAAPMDQNLSFTIQYGKTKQVEVLGPDSEELVIFALGIAPNGVQAMNRSEKDVVDTSLNLGIVQMERSALIIIFNVRSTNNDSRDFLCEQLTAFSDFLGGSSKTTGQYPAWPKRNNSQLVRTLNTVYRKLFDHDLNIVTIHGGLECSLFAAALPDLDIVSIGPDNLDIHTPNEHMSISSVNRTWQFLLEILKTLA